MKQLKLILATVIVGVGFLSFMGENQAADIGLEIGNEAPDIQTELIDGSSFELSDYRGKMVILNFWASYDAQSRMNNFHLNQIYSDYLNQDFHKGQDLVVVSISLDRFKSPLKLAIEQDETADFKHICDFAGNNGSIAKMYDINNPINILIDGEGRIVTKDVEYSKIEKSLSFLSAI
jgi:peroxiredoxin